MPAQAAVSVQYVEALARGAERALQETAASTTEDIARLTQETRETFGRVEEAFGGMDSKVESMGTQLEQLQGQHTEQVQRTQASLQSTTALEQRLQQAEERRMQEAAQHQAQMQEQKAHIVYLEGLVKTEVLAHKQANAALRMANEGQIKLKGEVQDLSAQLQAALDQIQNLSVDLATTRSLLDAGTKQKEGSKRMMVVPILPKDRNGSSWKQYWTKEKRPPVELAVRGPLQKAHPFLFMGLVMKDPAPVRQRAMRVCPGIPGGY